MAAKNVTKVAPALINKSKTLISLYKPMLIALLVFGYDFNFYATKTILRRAAKLYCISLVSIVSFANMTCCPFPEISQIWSLLEYGSSVIIILFFESKMHAFLVKLTELDVYLRIRRKHYFWDKYKMFIFTAFIWGVRAYYTYLYCNYYTCYKSLYLYLLSMFSPFALDLSRVWRCILFDTIRYRLTTLRVRLEENPEDNYYLYVNKNKTLREDKLKFCLFLYRSVADLVELVSPELYASLFMSVACNLPKVVLNVYHILAVLEGNEPKGSLGFIVIHLIQICGLLFSPFVIVELYAVEVEKIKTFLIHKLIDENEVACMAKASPLFSARNFFYFLGSSVADAQMREKINIFLQYIELRPFSYKIWRIIPINIAAPLEMINLCTTYVIVIINFTHLYG